MTITDTMCLYFIAALRAHCHWAHSQQQQQQQQQRPSQSPCASGQQQQAGSDDTTNEAARLLNRLASRGALLRHGPTAAQQSSPTDLSATPCIFGTAAPVPALHGSALNADDTVDGHDGQVRSSVLILQQLLTHGGQFKVRSCAASVLVVDSGCKCLRSSMRKCRASVALLIHQRYTQQHATEQCI
jgi:hypothetical protein